MKKTILTSTLFLCFSLLYGQCPGAGQVYRNDYSYLKMQGNCFGIYKTYTISIEGTHNITGTDHFYFTKKMGIGTNSPTRLLDVNGAFRVRSGGVDGDPLIDLDHSSTTGWSRINSEGKLALAANDKLTGSSSLPHLFIDNDGSIFVTGGANLPSVSSQSRSKYSLFVQKGLLSEDYGLGPQSTWADYVFSEDYQLMPLKALSSYIQKYKHLPNMPTENEIAKNGYSLHDINVKLTEKVEELTLYTIKQQQELDSLKKDYQVLLKLVKPILQKNLKNQKN